VFDERRLHIRFAYNEPLNMHEEKMDIIGLSSEELRELQVKVAAQLKNQMRAEREQAIERCYSIAHSLGMPLAALMDFSEKGKSSKPRKPKQAYRDPVNPNNTWSSSGPRPEWLKRALAAGVPLSQLSV